MALHLRCSMGVGFALTVCRSHSSPNSTPCFDCAQNRSFKFLRKLREANPDALAIPACFDKIQPTLAALTPAYIGLGLFQPFRKFFLSHTRVFSLLAKEGEKDLVITSECRFASGHERSLTFTLKTVS
jgi:hypothetical protein